MNKTIFLEVALLMAVLGGCKKDNSVNSPVTNLPVVANTLNAFSFELSATSYTGTQQYTLSFSTDTLACSLTIVGQTAGSGSLTIADSNYATVYADSILSNQVVAFTQSGKGIPKRISLAFNGYTGTITLALSRGSSSK